MYWDLGLRGFGFRVYWDLGLRGFGFLGFSILLGFRALGFRVWGGCCSRAWLRVWHLRVGFQGLDSRRPVGCCEGFCGFRVLGFEV